MCCTGVSVNRHAKVGGLNRRRVQCYGAVAANAFNPAFTPLGAKIYVIEQFAVIPAVKGGALLSGFSCAGHLFCLGDRAVHITIGEFAIFIEIGGEYPAIKALVTACCHLE